MPHQLHRLAMQPQTESASNLLFGGRYGSPSIPSLRRPQYSPGGSATMTAGGTPLSLPNSQPFNYSGRAGTVTLERKHGPSIGAPILQLKR